MEQEGRLDHQEGEQEEPRQLDLSAAGLISSLLYHESLLHMLFERQFPKDITEQEDLLLNQLNDQDSREILQTFMDDDSIRNKVWQSFNQDRRVTSRADVTNQSPQQLLDGVDSTINRKMGRLEEPITAYNDMVKINHDINTGFSIRREDQRPAQNLFNIEQHELIYNQKECRFCGKKFSARGIKQHQKVHVPKDANSSSKLQKLKLNHTPAKGREKVEEEVYRAKEEDEEPEPAKKAKSKATKRQKR